MKIVASAWITLALSIPGVRADLTFVQNLEGAGPASVMTIKIKGEKARIEASPEITTIIDSASGDVVNLINNQKKFMRVTASQAKAVAEMAVKADEKTAAETTTQLKPTGKKETILGHETQEYVCDAPAFKASYWISTTYPNAAAIVKQLQAMTPQAWNVAGKGMPDYRDFPGLPLRSHISFGGKEVVSTLVSVKQDPLPDSDFTAPAGFSEMKMPSIDALLGDKSPAPKAARSPRS